jgi:hypothetical protein
MFCVTSPHLETFVAMGALKSVLWSARVVVAGGALLERQAGRHTERSVAAAMAMDVHDGTD